MDVLDECWCLVTHSSNTTVDALREGVPVVVTGESVCEAVSWDFEDIENPHWPDRDVWAHEVAYNQFSIPEMRDGTAWRILNDQVSA